MSLIAFNEGLEVGAHTSGPWDLLEFGVRPAARERYCIAISDAGTPKTPFCVWYPVHARVLAKKTSRVLSRCHIQTNSSNDIRLRTRALLRRLPPILALLGQHHC